MGPALLREGLADILQINSITLVIPFLHQGQITRGVLVRLCALGVFFDLTFELCADAEGGSHKRYIANNDLLINKKTPSVLYHNQK